jgi:SsrA-binding protein
MALLRNKKIFLEFEILETFEAGIELFGYEVKSLRKGSGELQGAHITIRGNEAYIVNMNISPYQAQNTPDTYDPERARRLLLKKHEIQKLLDVEKQKGLTIVPISVYNKGQNLKLEIAIVRGKKLKDKREAIKAKDTERDIKRDLKQNFNI